MQGYLSLCVLTRNVLHERASVHDDCATRHDGPVTQVMDKRGEEPASGRSRPLLGGDAGTQEQHIKKDLLNIIIYIPRISAAAPQLKKSQEANVV